MKKLFLIISLLLLCSPLAAFARQDIKPDSTLTNLDEVVVTADALSETAGKVILIPSRQEKRHSTNGYELLENMNLPDFSVNPSARSIATVSGGNVVILINGIEAGPDELATLAASQISRIDYRRNPGGKYVGSGAVMNFITLQYDYGGNIYLSADEGLARQYGNYIGMANYKKKALTLSLTANAAWDHSSQLNSAVNSFKLNDGPLSQTISPISASTHTNSQYVNLKTAHASYNHSFDIALSLTRSATPRNIIRDAVVYTGLYDFRSEACRSAREKGLSPAIRMHYNLYLPGGNTAMANFSFRHGHTNLRSVYNETGAADIFNYTREDNYIAGATLGYFKTLSSGLTLGVTADEYFNYYHDVYSGSFTDTQNLMNSHAMAVFHLDGSIPAGLSYYVSAGMKDLYSTIGDHKDNQASPMAFYGLTYAISRRHSLSVSGN